MDRFGLKFYIFLFLFNFLIIGKIGIHIVHAQDISISTYASRTEVPLNRVVVVTTELKWRGQHHEYEIVDFKPPSCKNLRLIGSSSTSRTEGSGENIVAVRRYAFTFKPKELGMAYVEPTVVKYRKAGEEKIHTLLTSRISVKVTPAIREKGERPWWFWLAIFGPIIAGVIIGIILFIKKKRQQKTSYEPQKEKTPEEIALEELEKASVLKTASTVLEFYVRVSSILKNYIGSKFDIKVSGTASSTIIEELKERNLEDDLVEKAKKILGIADMVKFAGHRPNRMEVERTYELVREFILQEKKGKPPTSEEEKEPDEQEKVSTDEES
jgi:hypothetical protein